MNVELPPVMVIPEDNVNDPIVAFTKYAVPPTSRSFWIYALFGAEDKRNCGLPPPLDTSNNACGIQVPIPTLPLITAKLPLGVVVPTPTLPENVAEVTLFVNAV